MTPRSETGAIMRRYAYAVGDLGLNLFWQSASFLLIYFYTETLGVEPVVAGLIFGLGGFIDAASDPLMGAIADPKPGRPASYRRFMAVGAGPLAVAFLLVFVGPTLAAPDLVAPVAALTLILFWLAYTVVSIPYGALAGDLTDDPRERVRLAGARMLCGAMGGVLVAGFVQAAGGARGEIDYTSFSALAGGLGAGLIIASASGTRRREPSPTRPTAQTSPSRIAVVAASRPFLILIAGMAALTIANVMLSSTLLFRFDRLNRPDLAPTALMVAAAAPLIGIPFWTWASLKVGPARASRWGCMVIALACVALAVGGQSHRATIMAYGLAALGASAFAVGFWSMLPETADHASRKTGPFYRSTFVGVGSALQKSAIALGGVLVGAMLSIGESIHSPSKRGVTPDWFDVWANVTPLALSVVAALIFTAYPLGKPGSK